MQLKLQLERQITELRSRVQELEMALVTARQEHAELMEQYKVGVGPGCSHSVQNLNPVKRVKHRH